jgi:hypothetical protein
VGESNSSWGEIAEHDDGLASLWDSFDRLPDPGVNDVLDAFLASKHINVGALARVGTRLSAPGVLAFAYTGGLKYREMESGRRWTSAEASFEKLKIIRAGGEPRDTVLIAEGETDGARLSMLYDADVAVLPAGARRFTQTYADQLEAYASVLMALDNDEAGEEGCAKITAFIPRAVRFAPPAPAKDWCALGESAPVPPLPEVTADNRVGGLTFLDIGPAFRGELPRPEVVVDDLLYESGVHGLSGHPGSGKSIMAMHIALIAMIDGRHVVWIDYENGLRMTGDRLRYMDAPADKLEELFHYVWSPASAEDALVALAERWPKALIVIDSISKALSAAGLDENSPGEVTTFTRKLISAGKGGNPIIFIDHVAKKADSEARYSRGAGAKLADVDVHWMMSVEDKFNREMSGTVKLFNAKDREGFLPVVQYFRVGNAMGGLPVTPCEGPVSEKDDPSL